MYFLIGFDATKYQVYLWQFEEEENQIFWPSLGNSGEIQNVIQNFHSEKKIPWLLPLLITLSFPYNNLVWLVFWFGAELSGRKYPWNCRKMRNPEMMTEHLAKKMNFLSSFCMLFLAKGPSWTGKKQRLWAHEKCTMSVKNRTQILSSCCFYTRINKKTHLVCTVFFIKENLIKIVQVDFSSKKYYFPDWCDFCQLIEASRMTEINLMPKPIGAGNCSLPEFIWL